MTGERKGVSRRAMLVSSAAAGLAGTGPAAAAAGAERAPHQNGVIGTVPRGKTRVCQLGEQKSFRLVAR